MQRMFRTSILLAASCASCATVPVPVPEGVPVATAGAWAVAAPSGVHLVADRVALAACFAPGGVLAGAVQPIPPEIDFGRHWCLLATDARRPDEPAAAFLAAGEGGTARLAIVGREPRSARVQSVRAYLVPRGAATRLDVTGQVLDLPDPASKAAVLPVLDVRGPTTAPASLHASWRITDADELQTMLGAFGRMAPALAEGWLDPAIECIVVARLPAGSGALARLHVFEEEGVDVLTMETAAAVPGAEAHEAHWIKLPRRARMLTLVHRASGSAGPVETVLGTWPPLR